ncbi:hypothetical protein ACKWTF_013578 [Chironomus riparius]
MQEPRTTGFSTKCEIFVRTLINEKEKICQFERDYSTFEGGRGWKNLISVSELTEKSSKYIKNGTLRIGAKIELIKADDNDNKPSTSACEHNSIFEHFYNSKIFSDLTIVCSDNIEIQAHRFALVFCSPVMKKMAEVDFSSIIKVEDIDSVAMTEILRYIYIKAVNGIDKLAPKLIYGAVKYELNGLKELCITAMTDNLSIENAVDSFLLADQYDAKELLDRSIEFIKENHQLLIENAEDWDKLKKKHLNMLLGHYKQKPEKVLILVSSFHKF